MSNAAQKWRLGHQKVPCASNLIPLLQMQLQVTIRKPFWDRLSVDDFQCQHLGRRLHHRRTLSSASVSMVQRSSHETKRVVNLSHVTPTISIYVRLCHARWNFLHLACSHATESGAEGSAF